MGLVGRDDEIARLLDALDGARHGRGSVVLLAGEPGIGKSSVVDTFRNAALTAGARVLWGAGWEDGSVPAYWPWLQVLEQAGRLGHPTSTVAEPLRQGSFEPERFVVFESVRRALAELAEDSPVVVVLDDLHASGTSSALLLEFLVRHLGDTPMVLVATYRPAEVRLDPSLREAVERLEQQAIVLDLAPLTTDQVERLLADQGVPATGDASRQLTDRTRGNPLFLVHAVREMRRLGVPADAVALPGGLAQALRRTADHLTASTPWPDGLAVAALLGNDLTGERLARALDADPAAAVSLLERATEAGLLRRNRFDPTQLEFTHALVREALYDAVRPADRARYHLRVAQVLTDDDAPTSRRAHHFGAAWPAGGAEEAAILYRRVGEEALAVLAYEDAVDAFESSLLALTRSAVPRDRERCEVLLQSAEALGLAGRVDEARRAAEHAAALAGSLNDATLLSRAAIAVSRHVAFNDLDAAAVGLLERADRAWNDADSPLRVSVLARLAVVHATDQRSADTYARRALATAERTADPTSRAVALAAGLQAGWGRHEPAAALRSAEQMATLARESRDAALAVDAAMWRFVFSLELGDADGAARALAEVTSRADSLHLPALQHLALSRRSTLNALRGEYAQALVLARTARELAERTGLPDADAVYWGQLFAVWRETGLPPDDAAEMERIARLLTDHSPFRAAHEAAVVEMVLARGDRVEAVDRFEALMTGLDRLPRDMLHVWTLALLAADCVALERSDAAARLYPTLEPYADRFVVAAGGVACLGSAHQVLGDLAHLLGRTGDARRHYEAAAAAHRAAGCPTLLARSERSLAALQPPAPAMTLTHDAAVFTLTLGDAGLRLPASRGLSYLEVLIANPDVDVPATQLVAGGVPAPRPPEDLLAASRTVDAVLDRRALASYRARLAELDEELTAARDWNDSERVATLEVERDFLIGELGGALGLGGRSRQFSNESEKARLNVTRAIRRAIDKIRYLDPEVADVLEARVTTGSRCRYSSASPPAAVRSARAATPVDHERTAIVPPP